MADPRKGKGVTRQYAPSFSVSSTLVESSNHSKKSYSALDHREIKAFTQQIKIWWTGATFELGGIASDGPRLLQVSQTKISVLSTLSFLSLCAFITLLFVNLLYGTSPRISVAFFFSFFFFEMKDMIARRLSHKAYTAI